MSSAAESDVDTSADTGTVAFEEHIESAECLLQRPWEASLAEWIAVAAAVMGSGITAVDVHAIFVEVAAIVGGLYKEPDTPECFSDPLRLASLTLQLADMETNMHGQAGYLTITPEKLKQFKRHIYRGILWEAAQTFNWWYFKDTRRKHPVALTPLNPRAYCPRGSGSSPAQIERNSVRDEDEAEFIAVITHSEAETGKFERPLQAAIRTASQTGSGDTLTSTPTIAETLESLKAQIRSRDEEFATLNQHKEKVIGDLERELAAKIARNQRLEAELAGQ